MTRDEWLDKCAERLREKAGMDPGEAAAYAIMLHESQVRENGREPTKWEDPVDTADDEISYMSDDEEGCA